ncbi:hypothetical protein NUW58_g7104 [Xylaria curta]|uniref:Uncharacterized protein n=1 Tax=Xylaria curta TaxID=42375 RepID=A0ACC1NKG1_9PEZI|nr:hypothetical protein NUW58_g7104 [Xylaria curta]
MSVYVVTGVSRGIGWEFMKQLSENPADLFVGIVRNKPATVDRVKAELSDRSNIHIVEGDLASYASLKQAAAEVESIVGDRGIDYIVANGGLVSEFDAFGPIGALADKPEVLEAGAVELLKINVLGNIHLFNLLIHLVKKGKAKKVITISSGVGDVDLTNEIDNTGGALYAASKAQMNLIVAKFSTQYKPEGILFISISPGLVEVGRYKNITPEQMQGMGGFIQKLAAYAPHFKGPISPEESVKCVRATWEKASIENGSAGAFVSHNGDKQWV